MPLTAEFRSSREGRVLTVSADSPHKWIQTKSKTIFVRPCYEEIWAIFADEFLPPTDEENSDEDRIDEHDDRLDGMIVTGTPGCGKSCFLDFCLHQLRSLDHSVLYVHGKSGKAFVYSADNRVVHHKIDDAIFCGVVDQVDFALLDPPEGGDPNFFGLDNLKEKPFILSVSPDEDNCQSIRKDAQKLQVNMGPVSLEEAKEMRQVCYSKRLNEDILSKRYDEFGGIPRYLFLHVRGDDNEDILLNPYRSQQKAALFDVVVEPQRADDGDISKAYKGLWTLYHIHPLKTADGKTNFYDFIVAPCCDNAHTRIRDALMQKEVKDLWHIYMNTREEMGALRGIRYEAYAHKKIMTDGLQAGAVGLTVNGLSTAKAVKISIPAGLRRVDLVNNSVGQDLVEAVTRGRKNEPGSYLLPRFPNYPVVDSIYVPHGTAQPVLLQMKAGKSRPLASDKAASISNVTGGTEALYFVTPDATSLTKRLPGADQLKQYRVILSE